MALYVEKKKDSLLEKARAEISARLGGTLKIGHLDISLLRNFPAVSLQLTDVSLRDSAWEGHHHDLLHAGGIYVSCSVLRSLFHTRIELSTVSVEHATIYFYTDSTGYSNTYLFKSRSDSTRSNEKRKPTALPDIVFSDVRWVVDMQDRHKLFDLQFQRLNAAIDQDDRTLRFDINTALTTKSFAFNTEKGSFVREKPLSGHFGLTYNTASRIVQIDRARLQIDGYWFIFSGRFFPTVKPDPFFLTIDAEAIPFRKATALLTSRLEEKLDEYDIDKSVTIHAQLDAGAADQHEPQIQVRVNVEHGGVLTPTGHITDASFQASFTNEWVHGHPREDENSGLRFIGFSGQLDGIPLRADTVVITNLKHPQMACDLHSQFSLDALNAVYGSETLQFGKGSCRMDLRYKGPLSENDTAGATVNGQLNIDSAAITYLPYQFQLTNANGRIVFRDQDMVIDHLEARAGNTRFRIKGVAKNLISLIDHNAENVSMDWTLSAAHLALEDFLSLAGRSAAGSARRGRSSLFGATASRIDHFLKDGLVHVNLDAADISYGNFVGAHAKADLSFQDGEMRLSRMTVDQSAGSLDLKGTLVRRGEGIGNPLTLESHVEGVDLPGLFRSFDNFGLKAITANNLKGRMSADIKLSGLLTNKAQVVQNSLKGTVAFRVTDGQLVDFEPMEKIHEKVLKKRDLSEIHFGTLENELDLDSTTIVLHRMEIQSTAITLYAEGIYDLKKGADMSLQIPLSNLKTRDGDIPPESRGNDSKGGLSLHLRAKTGEDGKLKISWDPFRKALKKGKKA